MVAGVFPLLGVLLFFLCQDVPCRCGNQPTDLFKRHSGSGWASQTRPSHFLPDAAASVRAARASPSFHHSEIHPVPGSLPGLARTQDHERPLGWAGAVQPPVVLRSGSCLAAAQAVGA